MGDVIGYRPDGRVAFRSMNLRGILTYKRKHDIVRCEMHHYSKGGIYRLTFADGVKCEGTFSDPRVMLGFFLAGRRVMGEVLCERALWNMGIAMGTVGPRNSDGTATREGQTYGPWRVLNLYRCEHHVAMVRLTRG